MSRNLRSSPKRHGLLMITIADLIKLSHAERIARQASRDRRSCRPNAANSGCMRSRTWSTSRRTWRWSAETSRTARTCWFALHSQCLTGDVLHSDPLRLWCAARSGDAAHRGRRTRACCCYSIRKAAASASRTRSVPTSCRTKGFDTVEANERLGFKADQRDYGMGVQILRELGVRSMRLLSNNPRKLVGIEGYGLSVSEWLPLEIPASDSTRPVSEDQEGEAGTQAFVRLAVLTAVGFELIRTASKWTVSTISVCARAG